MATREKGFESFTELVELFRREHRHEIAFQYKENETVIEKTYLDFYGDIQQLAQAILLEYGEDQRIALIGKTSYQWLVTYIATILSGNVSIPIDSQLSVQSIHELLVRGEVNLVFYDQGLAYGDELIANPLWQYLSFDGSAQEVNSWLNLKNKVVQGSTEIILPATTDLNKTVVILFTSGTTGQSKGVCLSQRNIMTVVGKSQGYILIKKGDKALSILPINHAYELNCGIFPLLSVGGTIAINDSLRNISANLKLFKPNSLFIVPLIAESLYQKIWQQATASQKDKKLRQGIKLNQFAKKFNLDLSQRLFKEIYASLGGQLKRIVCGGAQLNPEIAQGFIDLGFDFAEGYGITECAPLVAVNPEWAVKVGSLGKPLPNCQVQIYHGEILVKGEMVANGYHNDPDGTAEAFMEVAGERWFKTGDLGRFDQEGYLYLTGRKKNLIVLANGENVSPEALEQIISSIKGVQEIIVSQVEHKISAEIFPTEEYLKLDPAKASTYFYQEIMEKNKELPMYQRIAKVKIRQVEFAKTTTKKIKRSATDVEPMMTMEEN